MVKKKISKLAKKKLNPNSSYWRKANDKLWSEIVKQRDNNRCIVCGSTKLLNAHHLITRNNYPTRWQINNGVSLCPSCHKFNKLNSAHSSSIVFADWLWRNRPEQYSWVLQNYNRTESLTYLSIYQDLLQIKGGESEKQNY